jgi:probable phosphoglycerate mutase
MDYGDWAGLAVSEVGRRWPDLFRQWRMNPLDTHAPGGECGADLYERAVAAVGETLHRHASGETIVLVSHQAVTKTLVCALLGLPKSAFWGVRQDLCNLTLFDYDTDRAQFDLIGLNDTCHLSPSLPQAGGDGTRIVLVRHGQTSWNAGAGEERFRGRTDLPLDDLGLAQARALSRRLWDEPLAALYTSPLHRARQTLAPLADELGLETQAHDGLVDIDYGQFQGMTHLEASNAYPGRSALWRSHPSRVCFPGGESLAEVQARLLALLYELSARYPSQTVVLAGHQIVNKVMACTLLGLDLDQVWRIQQDTAGFDIFQKTGSTWHTLALNETCHL